MGHVLPTNPYSKSILDPELATSMLLLLLLLCTLGCYGQLDTETENTFKTRVPKMNRSNTL